MIFFTLFSWYRGTKTNIELPPTKWILWKQRWIHIRFIMNIISFDTIGANLTMFLPKKVLVTNSSIVWMECSTWYNVQGDWCSTQKQVQTVLRYEKFKTQYSVRKFVQFTQFSFISTGICTWPDEAQKKGCSSEGMLLSFLKNLEEQNSK